MFFLPRLKITNSIVLIALLSASSSVLSQDDVKAERLFRRCAACHTLSKGSANRVGPNLFGVFERGVAAKENYNYSKALRAVGGDWTDDKINQFLLSPRTFARGTKMAFAGLRKTEDRKLLIDWLKQQTKMTEKE